MGCFVPRGQRARHRGDGPSVNRLCGHRVNECYILVLKGSFFRDVLSVPFSQNRCEIPAPVKGRGWPGWHEAPFISSRQGDFGMSAKPQPCTGSSPQVYITRAIRMASPVPSLRWGLALRRSFRHVELPGKKLLLWGGRAPSCFLPCRHLACRPYQFTTSEEGSLATPSEAKNMYAVWPRSFASENAS